MAMSCHVPLVAAAKRQKISVFANMTYLSILFNAAYQLVHSS